MLILFDIDLTLVTTRGCGMRAMVAAGRDLFGERFTAEGVDFAGRLDPLIIGEMFVHSGVEWTPANVAAFRARYTTRLGEVLDATPEKTALPGVLPLLAALRDRAAGDPHLALGVLTGNFAETGSMKLRACGIDPAWFGVQAWGDDGPHTPPKREHLVPVAIGRYETTLGRAVDPRRVVVVGDTPHDVHAAKSNGCRAIAVATGRSGMDELRAREPDMTLADLSDTAGFLAFVDQVARGA